MEAQADLCEMDHSSLKKEDDCRSGTQTAPCRDVSVTREETKKKSKDNGASASVGF